MWKTYGNGIGKTEDEKWPSRWKTTKNSQINSKSTVVADHEIRGGREGSNKSAFDDSKIILSLFNF